MPLYIGMSFNIERRRQVHFTNSKMFRKDSTFHNYCLERGMDKSQYSMYVLPLDDMCKTDIQLLERHLLNLYYDTSIINKYQTKKLNRKGLKRLWELHEQYNLRELLMPDKFIHIDEYLEGGSNG